LKVCKKTVRALADVEVPKETLKEITQTLRGIDERLASFLPPPPKKAESDSESEAEQKQEQPSMESDASSSQPLMPGVTPAKLEKADEDSMVSEDEKKSESDDEPDSQPKTEEHKPADATAMVDDSQTVGNPVTRQDSCLLKINTISTEIEAARPKVEEVKKLVDDLDFESLKKDPVAGLEKVESVQKQSRYLSEQFMRALLALDAMNTNETTRPLRRNQVIEVQQLMDQMDQINSKLNSYASELLKDPIVMEKKKRESEESLAAHKDPVAILEQNKKQPKPQTPKPEKKETEMEEPEKNDEEQKGEEGEDEEEEGKDEEKEEEEEEEESEVLVREMTPLFKSLKLRPRFDQQQERGAYILTAMIPGLKRDEIVVKQDQDPNDGSDELVVSGTRVPTVDEMRKMLHHIKQLQQNRLVNLRTKRDLQLALMQLGRGRYGSFEERFVLPEDAIPERVTATYEGGRLGLAIPRQAQRRYASPYRGSGFGGGYPFDGFGGRGGFGGFPGFF